MDIDNKKNRCQLKPVYPLNITYIVKKVDVNLGLRLQIDWREVVLGKSHSAQDSFFVCLHKVPVLKIKNTRRITDLLPIAVNYILFDPY